MSESNNQACAGRLKLAIIHVFPDNAAREKNRLEAQRILKQLFPG